MKKGFTLIELLAVIVILAVILVIAVPRILKVVNETRNAAYKSNEKIVVSAVRNYLVVNSNLMPSSIGNISVIKLDDLVTNKYIKSIKDSKNPNTDCNGYVVVNKVTDTDYNYDTYLKCGSNYETEGYISQTLQSVEVLVVAGGGSGGSHSGATSTAGGGGGAGGLIYQAAHALPVGNVISVNVGAGGIGTSVGGNIGGNSTFNTLTAIGGGRGTGNGQVNNASGGSGGGGSYYGTVAGTGTAGQGFAGGDSITQPPPYPAAGGGGAGSKGVNSTATLAGDGGNGLYYGDKFGDDSGSTGWFAGGGGGGIGNAGVISNRGIGKAGGGDGGYHMTNGTNALNNTGSGGGGSGMNASLGGTGGSGVVIVKYAGLQRANGGTVTTVGNYTIHTFKQTGLQTFETINFN